MLNELWQKACSDSACAEVRFDGDLVQFRSTNEPDVIVTLTSLEWTQFLEGAKTGVFDLADPS